MLMADGKGSLREYLVVAVGENRPWDRIFRELMLPDQTDKAQQAASAYLLRGLKDLDRLTADVSSTFFGVNVSCAAVPRPPSGPRLEAGPFLWNESLLQPHVRNRQWQRAVFLAEHAYGDLRFKTTDDIERKARLMFLTGRRVDEPNAKEPSSEDKKKETRCP